VSFLILERNLILGRVKLKYDWYADFHQKQGGAGTECQ